MREGNHAREICANRAVNCLYPGYPLALAVHGRWIKLKQKGAVLCGSFWSRWNPRRQGKVSEHEPYNHCIDPTCNLIWLLNLADIYEAEDSKPHSFLGKVTPGRLKETKQDVSFLL